MNNKSAHTSSTLFRCPICGLRYREKARAQECEAWCREHQSCNIEIIAHAVDNNTKQQ